jgi:hypothetical protein
MTSSDTSVTNALATCNRSLFHTVYIIDPARDAKQYLKIDLIQTMRKKGITFVFLINDHALLDHMLADQMYVDVPPDLYALPLYVSTLINHARGTWRTSSYRRFALAPTYEMTPSLANGFTLLLHVFWSLMGLFVGSRQYRATYMTLTILTKQGDLVMLPTETFRNRDKAPFIFGESGVRSKAPPGRSGLEHFLYLASKEAFSLRVTMVLLVYLFSLSVPWYNLMLPYHPTRGFDLDVTIQSLFTLASSGRIAWWAIHGLIALYYNYIYFDSIGFGALLAFGLPIVAIPFIFCVVYARVIWKGHGARAPVLRLPELLPRTRDFRESADLIEDRLVYDEDDEMNYNTETILPPITDDDDDGDDDDDEEEEKHAKKKKPHEKVSTSSRRSEKSAPKSDISGSDESADADDDNDSE